MSTAVEKDGGDLNGDVENRSMGLRRTKRDDSHNRSNIPQASKRPALGNIALNAVRIQPFRNAKQQTGTTCDGRPQDENAPPLATKSYQTTKVPGFAVFCDGQVESASVAVAQTQAASRLQLHSGVVGLQRQPLAVLPVDSSFREEEELDENSGSPMVLDDSLEDNRLRDAHSSQDIFLTPEYAQDIYRYLREAELRHRPKPHYLKKQPDITAGMRSILVDWLVEVGEEYKLQTETLYLAVSYIDRFLSCMSVLRGKLQLVGTACMFIAAKYEEIYPPDVGEFVYITDDTYTKKQVLRMEHLILKVLSFDLAVPTIYYFLERFCKIEHASETTEYLSMYLSELTLLEADPYLRYLPSIVAGSAVCLANIMTQREVWSEHLRLLTGYGVEDFQECLRLLHNTLKGSHNYAQQAVREKYRSHKFLRVADLDPPPALPF